MSRVIGPSSNASYAAAAANTPARNINYTSSSNELFSHQPHLSQRQESPSLFSSGPRYNVINTNNFHRHHSFDQMGAGNVTLHQSYYSSDNPYQDPIADNQSRHWNPDSDTVGSVPTQFFLAP